MPSLLTRTCRPLWMCCFAAVLPVLNSANGDDWPQFLGPHRIGVSAESGLLREFPGDGPRVLWKSPLGVGMSSCAVVGEAVVTMYQDEANQYVACLNARNGELIWETSVAPAYKNAMGNGPRATPTIAGESVFAYTGEGVLVALSLKTGTVDWSQSIQTLAGGKSEQYGNASSPLVLEKVVVVQFDGADNAVVACDRATGKLAWQAGAGTAGYSSPVLMELDGRPQVVAFCGQQLVALSPNDGKKYWSYAYRTDYDCNTATPVQVGSNRVLITSGENHGTTLLEITGLGDTTQVSTVWESTGKNSALRAEWQTPVLIDGYLYGLDNLGSAGPITNLVCVRLEDGQQMWNERRFGKCNFTMADGRFYFTTMKGELIIGEATPKGFTESSRSSLLGMTRQAPAIANGRLFVRDDEAVYCVDLRSR